MKGAKPGLMRYIRPLIPDTADWTPYLRASYAERYFTNTGPVVRDFEHKLRQRYARSRMAVTGPNATNSLVAALQALEIRGRVLTPSYTFTATAQAILMAGCEPVFCDIAEDTWGLDVDAAARLLDRGDVAAILHVRPYGFAHDATALQTLAREHGIPLVIDSAAALGVAESLHGHVGQQGAIEVFSLHATKVFAIGEGSVAFMPVELEERFRRVSNFGIHYPDDVTAAGLNSKLSDFQAAVGLAVLDRIDGYIACRRQAAQYYHRSLTGLPGIHSTQDPALSPWQSYPVRLASDRDVGQVLRSALHLGLELKRGYYKPLHQTSFFARYACTTLPATEAVACQVLCLPVYSDMSSQESERVVRLFLQALGG